MHDFRDSSLNITPSVYLLSHPDCKKLLYEDELHRQRYSKETNGDLHVRLRPSYITASAINHLDDLCELLPLDSDRHQAMLESLLIISDQGPDESPSSIKFLYFLGHLFSKFNIGMLLHVYYAPGQSSYNPVERKMALLKDADGVYLPEVISGEDKTPSKQKDLSEAQMFMKNKVIFEANMATVEECYRRSAVTVKPVWNAVSLFLPRFPCIFMV